MRLSATTLLAILPFLGSALASDVLDLTESNFKSEVLGQDLALVEFFAPWCGHCKNLAPHYEEAATELKSKGNIKLAKVDCTENQPLCNEYGVSGYPTLKVFRNGSPTDYAGPRKADGIISYMVKQSLPAISQVTSASHDEFTKSDKVVLVSYGETIPGFDEYANSARDSYLFGHYADSNLPTLPESVSLPAIILFKSFDEGYAVFPADQVASASSESLAAFVKENSVPLFDEISPENFGTYAGQGLPIAYLFADPEDASNRDQLVKDLTPLAKEHKGKISFVHIDAVKFIEHGKSLNLAGDSWPAFVIQDLAEGTKYPLTESVSKGSIESFVKAFASGGIQPSIKSEPIPTTNDSPVFHLVSDQWDEVLGDKEKDILVEFFAPWCGHCQRLAPVWETLGEKYAKNSNIVIAQMDATLNDIPPQAPFKVQGFPTLKFKPAGSLEFVDYNGDRSLESLIEFVETNKKSESGAGAGDEDEEEFEEEDDVVEHDEL